jgi:hypothetical protein
MADQLFRYATLDAPKEFTADLSSSTRQSSYGAPTLVAIECGACGHTWKYRVVTEGLGYARVSCPGCGRTEPYAGHV